MTSWLGLGSPRRTLCSFLITALAASAAVGCGSDGTAASTGGTGETAGSSTTVASDEPEESSEATESPSPSVAAAEEPEATSETATTEAGGDQDVAALDQRLIAAFESDPVFGGDSGPCIVESLDGMLSTSSYAVLVDAIEADVDLDDGSLTDDEIVVVADALAGCVDMTEVSDDYADLVSEPDPLTQCMLTALGDDGFEAILITGLLTDGWDDPADPYTAETFRQCEPEARAELVRSLTDREGVDPDAARACVDALPVESLIEAFETSRQTGDDLVAARCG